GPFEELVRIARRRPASGEGDLFAHRSGEEAALGVLEDVGDASGIDPPEGPSTHGDRASCRRERAREQEPEGAFPRAVRPDERHDLAGADVERDAGDRVAIGLAIAVRDIAGGGNDGCHAGPWRGGTRARRAAWFPPRAARAGAAYRVRARWPRAPRPRDRASLPAGRRGSRGRTRSRRRSRA